MQLRTPDSNKSKNLDLFGLPAGIVLFLLVLSAIAVTVCSKSSPVYPLNNWDDANCFFTVGKSILNGNVMYQDIFEQKGPLLYFIYSIAYLISGNTFIGAYLIEIVSNFLFLIISAKILLLFTEQKAVYLMPLLAVAVYASPAFEQGGSAEELCLPLIACSVYFGMKSVATEQPVRKREWFIIGFTSGAVLWIKFSQLGFYFAFGLFMLIYYMTKKWHKHLVGLFGFLMLGIATVTLPIMLYFILNNALSSLFEVYFYCNMFVYPVTSVDSKWLGAVYNLYDGFKSFLYYFWPCLLFMIAGGIYAFRHSKRLFVFYIVTILSSFALIYAGGRRYAYYPLILAVFMPLGLAAIYSVLPRKLFALTLSRRSIACLSVFAVMVISLCTMFMFSPNTYMIVYGKEQLPQYKFSKIISETKNATLLNYKFLDGGFYTASGVVPECRFFCGLNIPYLVDEQDKYIEHALVDYVITRDKKYHFKNYELVSSETFETRKNAYNTYYLYKRKADAAISPLNTSEKTNE